MRFNVLSRSLRIFLVVFTTAVCAVVSGGVHAQTTLKAIKDRGHLICGVSQGIIGFSAQQANSEWVGFDVDFCRALAAAIFNDTTKVKFEPLSTNDRFHALQSGGVDILSRNSTWTMSREVDLGLEFAAVTYYDGQGFMVPRSRNISTALDLGGSKICVQSGTTTELNLSDYFHSNGMKYDAVLGASPEDVISSYDAGRCDTLTSDASQLHAIRLKLTKVEDQVILPDLISKEPLGPAVRQGDEQWFNIVKWTAFAMANAEELGVTSKNIEDAMKSTKPAVRRLIGKEDDYGKRIGLTSDWAARIIRLVGNYGEVYERNVGVKSRLGIPRGINERWTAGGIMYAPPIR
jgi:general L-amino acid transport system substrate-binding protein